MYSEISPRLISMGPLNKSSDLPNHIKKQLLHLFQVITAIFEGRYPTSCFGFLQPLIVSDSQRLLGQSSDYRSND